MGLGRAHNDSVGVGRINEDTANQVPFYKPNPIQQSGYEGGFGDMITQGAGRITESATYQSGQCDREGFNPAAVAEDVAGPEKWAKMSPSARNAAIQTQIRYFDQECDGINFLAGEYQTRHRAEIPPTDDLHNWTPDWNSPDPQDACTENEVVIPPEYSVEYCYESRTIEKRFCHEEVNVICEQVPYDGCEPGGVIPGSNSSDTQTSMYPSGSGTWHLEYGTIGNNYWSGGTGAVYDRAMTVLIEDIEKITVFALTRVDFDDWLRLTVNGHQVYNGPNGGDRLELVEQTQCVQTERVCVESSGGDNDFCLRWEDRCVREQTRKRAQYSEGGFGSPELETSNVFNMNIDIRPYLVEGVNQVMARTIVGGEGEMFTRFNVRAKCSPSCDFHWTDNCQVFEDARVDK